MHECLRKSLDVPNCVALALDYCDLLDIDPQGHADLRCLPWLMGEGIGISRYFPEARVSSGHICASVVPPLSLAPRRIRFCPHVLGPTDRVLGNSKMGELLVLRCFPLPPCADAFATNLANEIAMAVVRDEGWPDLARLMRWRVAYAIGNMFPDVPDARLLERGLDNAVVLQDLITNAVRGCQLYAPLPWANYRRIHERDIFRQMPTAAAARQLSGLESRAQAVSDNWRRNYRANMTIARRHLLPSVVLSPESPMAMLASDTLSTIFRMSLCYHDMPGIPLLAPPAARQIFPVIKEFKSFDRDVLHIPRCPDNIA
jgi:hypothetical protein